MKTLSDELNVSLKSKTPAPKPVEAKNESGGFAAVTERLRLESNARATIATTVRLSEASDKALKTACGHFQKSKADLVKVCVEEFLKEHNFLADEA